MADNIDIPLEASGEDGINRLISAVDKLVASMNKMGGVSGPDQLRQQVEAMQASMTTGFAEISNKMGDFNKSVRVAQEKSNEAILKAQVDHDNRLHAQANKFHDRQIELEVAAENKRAATLQGLIEKRDIEEMNARAAASARIQAIVEKRDIEEYTARASANAKLQAIIEKRDVEEMNARATAGAKLQAIIEKRDTEEYAARAAASARIQAIVEKRDIEEYTARASANAKLQAIIEKRDLDEYTTRSANAARIQAITEKRDLEEYTEREAAGARLKALVERQQLELYQIKAAAQEKERVLNTNFLTSSLPQQIATAEKASVYSSLGGDASAKYGSAAAAADVAALRKQYELLPDAVKKSQSAIEGHNHAMEEAHTLARGLAGGIGALWLSYGSLVPLAAGAAIASSLKNVVTVGKEVEYQLQFVAALSRETVPLDSFLRITDGTVVSVKAAAEGMRALAQNGLDVKQSLQVLPDVLNLSVIGELGVEQAALAATGALSAFGLQITEIGRVGDILAQTAASSNTSVKALMESLKQGSIAASIYGVSIEETAAALGTLAKVNIVGTQAGTAYNNLLTSLYAPSKKAAEAIKQLGIETSNADGSLKNSSVLLLELRNSLSKYSESAQAAFIGDITTNRGAKAVATLLQYLDEYDKKIGEAKNSTGFMSDAVLKLEDTVEGSFRRLENSASASFTRAFQDAAPALQGLVDQLARVARSDGAVKVLAALATGTISLTRALVDNASTIGVLVGAYVTFSSVSKIVMAVSEAWKVYTVSVAAAETATALLSATAKGLMATLGPIAIAIGVATTAWAIYQYQTDKQGNADQKLTNSIQTHIDMLRNETKALEERNKALRGETGAKTAEPTDSEQALDRMQLLQSEYDKVNKALKLAIKTDAAVMFEGERTNALMLSSRANSLKRQLDAARASYNELDALTVSHDKEAQINKDLTARAKLLDELDKFAQKGKTLTTIGGQSVAIEDQSNAAAQAKAKEALDIMARYKQGLITTDQAQAEFIQKRREYNALLLPAPAKQDNDAIAATLQRIQLEKQLFDIKNKTALMFLEAQKASGDIGGLGYLREKLALEKDAQAQAALTALAEANAVKDADKKKAALEKYRNLVTTSMAKTRELNLQEQIAEDSYIDKLQQDNLATEAETYKKKGDLLNAYITEFDAKYGTLISGLKADLADGKLDTAAEALLNAKDSKDYAAALREYNKVLAETVRLNNLMAERSAGVDTAIFGMSKQQFNEQLASAQEALSQAKAKAQEDGGLSGALGLADAATTINSETVPALQNLVTQLKAVAAQTGNADLAKQAADAGKALNALTKDLTKSAQPFGDAWTNVWNDVEKSAHSAWMKIGTDGESIFTKIGHTLKTAVLDMLYQLTIKKWMISIGASLGGVLGLTSAAASAGGGVEGVAGAGGAGNLISAANTASNLYKLSTGGGIAANIGGGISTLGNFLGSSTIAEFGSGVSGSAAAAASALGAQMTTAASAGAAFTSALSTAVPWIAGAVVAYKAFSSLFDNGPEQHTHLTFSSNNAAGNISINERGNEGRSASYIDAPGTGAFGTFGVTRSLWSPSNSAAITSFVTNVTKADDVFSRYLTSAETAAVKAGVTGKNFTAQLGAEGTDQNAVGPDGTSALDKVFSARLRVIFESVQTGLSSLLDGAQGTAKELADEGSAILAFRAGLTASMQTVYGTTVTLQELAALKTPTEAVSVALNRVQADFVATNQVAAALGKTTAEAFGAVGLASYNAREQLITLAGGTSALTSQVSGFAQNYLSDAEKLAPVAKALDAALASLGLKTIPTTRDEFKALVQGLDLTDAAQQKTFVSLMALQDAFAQVHPAIDSVAKSVQQIADERKGLQDQLDAFLPMADQLAKQRDALDASNRALFDQIQAHKDIQAAYDSESKALTDAISKSQSFVDSLKKFQADIGLGALSPLTPQQKYQEAKQQLITTAAAAQGGDATAQSNFTSAAQAFLEASKVANASGAQYVSDFAYVRTLTEQTQSVAEKQVDVATASLNTLKQQVSGLIQIDASVKTVAQAIKDLALAGGLNNPTMASQQASIEGLYESLLGRQGEAAGMQYWVSALQKGISLQDIAQSFINSPEYRQLHANGATVAPYTAPSVYTATATAAAAYQTSPAVVPGASATTPMYAQITDISHMTDITVRLDSLIQAAAQTLTQLQAMQVEQRTQVADEIHAQFTATKQAADEVAAAINAASSATLAAQQSTVSPV